MSLYWESHTLRRKREMVPCKGTPCAQNIGSNTGHTLRRYHIRMNNLAASFDASLHKVHVFCMMRVPARHTSYRLIVHATFDPS